MVHFFFFLYSFFHKGILLINLFFAIQGSVEESSRITRFGRLVGFFVEIDHADSSRVVNIESKRMLIEFWVEIK